MLHNRLMGAYVSSGVCLLEEDVLFRPVSVSMSYMPKLFWYENNGISVFSSGTRLLSGTDCRTFCIIGINCFCLMSACVFVRVCGREFGVGMQEVDFLTPPAATALVSMSNLY